MILIKPILTRAGTTASKYVRNFLYVIFRSMWAAEGDCAVRTVTDTAKLSGKSPYQKIIETLV